MISTQKTKRRKTAKNKGHRKCAKKCTSYDPLINLLRKKKEDGYDFVDWNLQTKELYMLSRKYDIKPLLISFRTKRIPNIHKIHCKIIKDIHYRFLNGYNTLTLAYGKVSRADMEIMESHGVDASIVKWRIFLN